MELPVDQSLRVSAAPVLTAAVAVLRRVGGRLQRRLQRAEEAGLGGEGGPDLVELLRRRNEQVLHFDSRREAQRGSAVSLLALQLAHGGGAHSVEHVASGAPALRARELLAELQGAQVRRPALRPGVGPRAGHVDGDHLVLGEPVGERHVPEGNREQPHPLRGLPGLAVQPYPGHAHNLSEPLGERGIRLHGHQNIHGAARRLVSSGPDLPHRGGG